MLTEWYFLHFVLKFLLPGEKMGVGPLMTLILSLRPKFSPIDVEEYVVLYVAN